MSLIKSKIRLLFNVLNNKIHFIVAAIVLLGLSYKYPILLILLLLYLFYILINERLLFVICFSVLLIISVVFTIKEINYQRDLNLNQLVKVTRVEKSNQNYLVKVKIGSRYLLLKTKEGYSIGTYLLIDGELEKYDINYPGAFDYQEYLHYQNIVGVIYNPQVKVVKYGLSIHYINYQLNNYIEQHYSFETSKYLKTLVIGNNDLLDMENISKIGISHLFVISGLHMNIIVLIITKILSLCRLKEKSKNIIIIVICFLYLFVADFMISIIRVWLSLFLRFLFKKSLTNLDIISLNILIVLIINPYYIYNISFILTYLIAFFMMIYQDICHLKNNIFNKLLNILFLTFIIQFLTLPITISINPDFNLISIFVNPLFIYFVTFIFLPSSFLTLILPFFAYVYQYMINMFEYLVNFFADMEFLTIPLGNINIYFKLFYYLVFFITLQFLYQKKYKRMIIFLILLMIWYNKGWFNLSDKIYFLDLPKGEASLIVSKNNQSVILVDSGEQTKNHELTKILKDLGIRKIDYLIISHSDTDHIGGAFDLVKYIRVKNVIFNQYEKNDKTLYFKRYVKKVHYLKQDQLIYDNNFKMIVLSPMKDYNDINDNSLVFILEVFNLKILFTGDISKKVEKDIIKEYQINVDFYKVAHHGSTTSTSIEFINKIKYRYAVIMSGYYNQFGFPKKEVTERFNPDQLLSTNIYKTIVVKVKKNKYDLIYFKK